MTMDRIFMFLLLAYLIGHFLYVIYYAIGLYHWNPFVKLVPISTEERAMLNKNFAAYPKLPTKLKEQCDKRIVWFRSRKKFVFRGNVARQEELKFLISASAVMISLGLKNYRMGRSLLRIIVYPSQYYSKINRSHHLGEYNPRLRTVILSADKIWEGFAVADDNRNLAMHELAHALCFEMLRGNTWESRKFKVGLKKIRELFAEEDFRHKLVSTQYFREYGLNNLQEFFSISVENFVETPSAFLNEFPELYAIMQRMLNFDFLRADLVNSRT